LAVKRAKAFCQARNGLALLARDQQSPHGCPHSGVCLAHGLDPRSFALGDELLYGRASDLDMALGSPARCPERWQSTIGNESPHGVHADVE